MWMDISASYMTCCDSRLYMTHSDSYPYYRCVLGSARLGPCRIQVESLLSLQTIGLAFLQTSVRQIGFVSAWISLYMTKCSSKHTWSLLSLASDNSEGMKLNNDDRVLLDIKFLPYEPQDYNMKVTKALESILKNGLKSISKGLENWNLKDSIILYSGQVYIPKNNNLHQDIVKTYHEHITTGHPGWWKTYKLVSRNFWWPKMSTFVCNFVDEYATCHHENSSLS